MVDGSASNAGDDSGAAPDAGEMLALAKAQLGIAQDMARDIRAIKQMMITYSSCPSSLRSWIYASLAK